MTPLRPRKALGVIAHPATYICDTKTRKVVHTIKGSSETYADEIIEFVELRRRDNAENIMDLLATM